MIPKDVDLTKVAYDKDYLIGTMDLTRLVFIMLNEQNILNIYDQIDAYFQTSEIRERMDKGNWSALMKGSKQVFNSIDKSNCANDNEKSDDIMLHWLADITVYLQWKYNLSSREFNTKCDARTLANLYYPLHETSINNAADKLYHKFYE